MAYCPLEHLFVIGYPGDVGGANTECWHTVKLWRRFGLRVTLIPTWQAAQSWQHRLDSIGCRTIQTEPDQLDEVPGLSQSIVVSFCNSHFLRSAEQFRRMGCKTVWIGCMNWLFAEERKHYRRFGPFDRYVFQSRYQESQLLPQLAKFGVRPGQCHQIRGAFALEEFPFMPLPRRPGEPFVIGRISRAARDKYSSRTWPIYARITPPIRAHVMAWDRRVEKKVGKPPPWARCFPAGAESSLDFLRTLHCMLPINGGAAENWPRAGLEAMAAGVPLVVENRWGWREMIRHGQTGFLADGEDQLVSCADRLARDEDLRMETVHRARKILEDDLADPERIWAGWQALLGTLV